MRVTLAYVFVICIFPLLGCNGMETGVIQSTDVWQDILNKIQEEDRVLMENERRKFLEAMQKEGSDREYIHGFSCAMLHTGSIMNSVYKYVVKGYMGNRDSPEGKLYPNRGILPGKIFVSYCKWRAFLRDPEHPLAKYLVDELKTPEALDGFAYAIPCVHILRRPKAFVLLRRYAKLPQGNNNTRLEGLNFTGILIHFRWWFTEKDLEYVNVLHRALGSTELRSLPVNNVSVMPYDPRCILESEEARRLRTRSQVEVAGLVPKLETLIFNARILK